jgi:integral membrane protein (TIGR01906 family)
VSGSLGRSAAFAAIGLASAVSVVAAAVVLLFNPLWVGFEQARTNVDRLTGFSLDDVHRVTNGVLADLIVGPAAFLQQVGGVDVFDPRERQHLVDVRGAFSLFFGLVVASVVVLAVAAVRTRDRAWLWRSVATGTRALAIVVVAVGTFVALFFDMTFELFHQLLFAGGSYTFDPLHERLVQLFPEQFWSETAIVLVIAILLLAIAVSLIASARSRTRSSSAETVRVATRPDGTTA